MASSILTLTNTFAIQSYLDSTLAQKAILAQPIGAPIVPSTEQQVQMPGYAVGLHPTSEAPVAVRFLGMRGETTETVILTPGQVIHPSGKEPFFGIKYGLPFGWLGGGTVHLLVFTSPSSQVTWAGTSPEVMFHRQRLVISAALPSLVKNWPMRFPWINAVRDTGSIPQQGKPQIGIREPTKVMLRLRFQVTAAGVYKVRFVWRSTDNFDLNSAGTAGTADYTYQDVIFDQDTSGLSGNYYQVMSLPDPFARMTANDGGMCAIDLSGGLIDGEYIDIERWGRL